MFHPYQYCKALLVLLVMHASKNKASALDILKYVSECKQPSENLVFRGGKKTLSGNM